MCKVALLVEPAPLTIITRNERKPPVKPANCTDCDERKIRTEQKKSPVVLPNEVTFRLLDTMPQG